MSYTKETTGDSPQVKPLLRSLLEADLPPGPFWQRFMQMSRDTLASEAAAMWTIPEDTDTLALQAIAADADFRPHLLQRDPGQASHVLQAAATDEQVLFRSAPDDNDPLAGRLFFAVPLHLHDQLFGVLEFVQTPDQSPEEFEQLRLQFLTDLAHAEQEQSSDAALLAGDQQQEFWQEFEEFSYNIHRSLNLTTVGEEIASDGCRLLRCDRVSVATWRGRKTKMIAVSDDDQINYRSEDVRDLQRIAAEAVAVGEIIEYRSDQAEIAPHLLDLFSQYIERTAVKMILAVPLYAAARRQPGNEDDPRAEPIREPIGCLLVEQFRENRLAPAREQQLPVVADAAGSALANALAQQQVWLLPTRRILGKSLDFFRGRMLAKTLAVLTLLFSTTLALTMVPYNYRVEAEGRLMPTVQQRIFAPWDGVVAKIHVTNGQMVSKDSPLLTLYNDELHAELVAARNELVEKKSEFIALKTELLAARQSSTDRATELELRGRHEETRVTITGLEKQIAILEAREALLHIKAPIDGIVATFQLEEKLRNRPVAYGEQLLEVMDHNSDWNLELELPEHRMGHLLRASDDGKQPLQVEYVLATDASGTYDGTLHAEDIAPRSEVGRESGVVVRLNVQTDRNQLPFLRIGGEATAKVDCGRMSLGYVLLGDVWEFVLRYAWI